MSARESKSISCCQPREIVPLIEPRAPRRVTSKMAVEKAEAHVRRRLRKYIVGLETLAAGAVLAEPARRGNGYQVVLRDEETGDERVVGRNLTLYTTPPNLAALQYLSDRAMGKVPQRYEVAGDADSPISIVPWMPPADYIPADYKVLEEPDGSENQTRTAQILPGAKDGAYGREEGSEAREASGIFEVTVETEG